jgi:Amt family ammonium transporter
MTSGVTALVVALMIKPRRGFPREAFVPHNLVFTVVGAGLLWFGWFGFNGGSAIASGKIAVVAFVSTHCAAAAGAMAWIFYDWIARDKPTLLGAASGAVAGLVAITPASGFVSPGAGLIIGAVAGVACAYTVGWRARRGIDDALDAFGVHGVGGTLGAILTGVFASHYLNSAVGEDAQGLIHGDMSLFLAQIYAVLITIAYTAPVSWVLLKVLDLTMGLRVGSEEEQMGLDLTEHGEAAYS